MSSNETSGGDRKLTTCANNTGRKLTTCANNNWSQVNNLRYTDLLKAPLNVISFDRVAFQQ